jgi:hypothetical protein
MHLGKALAIIYLTASSEALGFKIRAFEGANCSGKTNEINAWDNTYHDQWAPPTKSFRVLSYGGSRQRAKFYKGAGCDGKSYNFWWVYGGSDPFKKNACLNLKDTAHAYGSWN